VQSPHHPLIAAGVDVGGKRKGFHAVALRGSVYLDQMKSPDAAQVAAWCRNIGAQFIGVDAPCRWSGTGRARIAERALMAKKIWCFSTPTHAIALAHPKKHYDWMLARAALFDFLETHYPLFNGRAIDQAEPACFETFPHAVTCAMRGEIVSAKNKRKDRATLLEAEGIKLSRRPSMDMIDAAICALVAAKFTSNSTNYYGDAESGFIVTPDLRDCKPR